MKKKDISVVLVKISVRLFLYLWVGFSLFALLWIVITSLKTNNEFISKVWGIFETPQIANYAKVWGNYNLGSNFLNSIFVVSISVLGVLAVSAPAAYVIARIKFPFRFAFKNLFILGMGVPFQLLLIPLFFIMFNLKLINNLWGLILIYISLSIPFTVFLLIGFYKTIPHQMEEAACIDGCGPIRTFLSIILPMVRSGIITASIFNFVGLWNEFLLALAFLSSESKYTLSLGLYALQGSMQYTGDWVSLFAGFVVVIIPTLIVYIGLSKQLIEGLTMGAVKE